MVRELLRTTGCCVDDLSMWPQDAKGQRRLPELQAPEGTYQLLSSIEEGLGSVYTKRFVSVKTTEAIPDRLEVEVRLKGQKLERGREYTYYKFGINTYGQVDSIEAEIERPTRRWSDRTERITPPSFAEILGHIQEAIRIEPTLKPQR